MSVYMGEEGLLTIQRTSTVTGSSALTTVLEPADVVVKEKRFSADFPQSALINGDRIEISTQDGSNLVLVDGHIGADGRWYCHVDDVGGIRLYTTFVDAITGKKSNALALVEPTSSQALYIRSKDDTFNCVAQTKEWSLTTSREAVDLTVLGESFRDQYSNGLISGQGQTTCFWEYKYDACDSNVSTSQELAQYYAQLLLRLQQGSVFKGRFFTYYCIEETSVWYDADCVVTNVGFAFAPGQPVRTDVQFVTSGEIKLTVGVPKGKLLLEDNNIRSAGDFLLQEDEGLLDLEPND